MKRRKFVSCVFFIVLQSLLHGQSQPLSSSKSRCMRPLLNKISVPDSSFNASSYFSDPFIPANARMSSDGEEGHSAWCPKSQIGREKSEYLQIEFNSMKLVTVIETRGRFAGNKGKEFVPYYFLKYQRESGQSWIEYRDIDQNRKMKGNDDIKTPAHLALRPYIVAKRIRLLPYSDPVRFVCLRIEIYGCDYTPGVLEYQIPQGERFSTDISYADFTYDGVRAGPSGDLLAGGLGQLTDGIVMRMQGENDPYLTEQKGYHYVGWKRRADGMPVTLLFRFDKVRQFEEVRFHTSNRRTKDICIFARVVLKFSVGGRYFERKNTLEFNYRKDEMIETSRFVDFKLNNLVGKFVKVELYFDCGWILIDEVIFTSTPDKGKATQETGRDISREQSPDVPPNTNAGGKPEKVGPLPTTAGLVVRPPRQDRTDTGRPGGGLYTRSGDSGRKEPGYNDYPGNDWNYLIAIVCILVGACFVVAVISFICIRRRRSRNKKKAAAKQLYMSAVPAYKAPASVVGTVPMRPSLPLDLRPDHAALAVDGNVVNETSLYTSLPSDDGTVGCGGGPGSDVTYASASGSFATPYGLSNGVGGLGTGKRLKSIDKPGPFRRLAQRVLSGLNPSVGAEYASTSLFGTPPPSYSNAVGAGAPGGIYSKPQIIPNPMADLLEGPYSSASSSGPYSRPAPSLSIPPPIPRFPSDLSIQGVSGNTVYAAPCDLDLQATPLSQLPVREVSSGRLTFLEKLGGGQFGEVHLAQLRPSSPPPPEEYEKVDLMEAKAADDAEAKLDAAANADDDDGPALVAVKMLRPDASDAAKRDFQNEIRVLSRLHNQNVVRLLGICSEKEQLSMLVEYMKFGDLNQFLQGYYPADLGTNGPAVHPSTKTLSYGALIYMAMQIANGMKYLESLNIFHRDLACRNCLVGSHYTIKISDFGMCRRLYSSDYYRIEGRVMLAIRWMAWESLIMGKFSSKSDVWSFGVTLWEILTFCRQQPFARLSDEEVIKNCANMYVDNTLSEYLPCPSNCPKEIYDLMLECWNKEELARPSFREIHMFLQRKNFGFNSKDDFYCRDKEIAK